MDPLAVIEARAKALDIGAKFFISRRNVNLSAEAFHDFAVDLHRTGEGDGFAVVGVTHEQQSGHRRIELLHLRRVTRFDGD